MNTKFKKTALEDDAEIYQHGTKSATKDDIKKLPPKKRIAYFCDYYLAKCLVVLALIICIILIICASINGKQHTPVLSVALINEVYLSDTDALCDEIKESLELDEDAIVNVTYYTLNEYQNNMSYLAHLSAGSVDVILCSEEFFTDSAPQGMFADLSTLLSKEELSAYSSQLKEASIVDTDTDGKIISKSEPAPMGIDAGNYIICLTEKGDNPENAKKAVSFFTTHTDCLNP